MKIQRHRTDRAEAYRRTLAIAIILSVAIHAAVLAFTKIDGAASAADETAEVDRRAPAPSLEERPLRLVSLSVRPAGEAVVPTENALPVAEPKVSAPALPRTETSLALTPVAVRDGGAEFRLARAEPADASAKYGARYEGVTFTAANDAARRATARRGGDRDVGALGDNGRSGGGISISFGGGDCAAPGFGGAAVNRAIGGILGNR